MPVLDVSISGKYVGRWNLDEVQVQDGVALKAVSGLDLLELDRGLEKLDPVAWQAIVWHLRRQTEKRLHIRDVNFRMGDIDAEVVREGDPEVPSEAEAQTGTSADVATD